MSVEYNKKLGHKYPMCLDNRALYRLVDELKQEGVVVVRGVLPRSLLKSALNYIETHRRIEEKMLGTSISLLTHPFISKSRDVIDVIEHPNLARLLHEILCELQRRDYPSTAAVDTRNNSEAPSILTTKYKWLRSVNPSLFTGLHRDSYYLDNYKSMQNPNEVILTTWIPFHRIGFHGPTSNGPLTWLKRSHLNNESLGELRSRASFDAEISEAGTSSGWVTDDASSLQLLPDEVWITSTYRPGDVAIFSSNLLHMTLPNTNPCKQRISCDVRWRLPRIKSKEKKEHLYVMWKKLKVDGGIPRNRKLNAPSIKKSNKSNSEIDKN